MRKSRVGFQQSEESRPYLERFVKHFIERRARDRWIHLLCDRPEKAVQELHKFEHDLVPARCTRLSTSEGRDRALLNALGDAKGVFFDGRGPARGASLTEVLKGLGPFQEDALFSTAGGPAVFFHHDGMIWLCLPPES